MDDAKKALRVEIRLGSEKRFIQNRQSDNLIQMEIPPAWGCSGIASPLRLPGMEHDLAEVVFAVESMRMYRARLAVIGECQDATMVKSGDDGVFHCRVPNDFRDKVLRFSDQS